MSGQSSNQDWLRRELLAEDIRKLLAQADDLDLMLVGIHLSSALDALQGGRSSDNDPLELDGIEDCLD